MGGERTPIFLHQRPSQENRRSAITFPKELGITWLMAHRNALPKSSQLKKISRRLRVFIPPTEKVLTRYCADAGDGLVRMCSQHSHSVRTRFAHLSCKFCLPFHCCSRAVRPSFAAVRTSYVRRSPRVCTQFTPHLLRVHTQCTLCHPKWVT